MLEMIKAFEAASGRTIAHVIAPRRKGLIKPKKPQTDGMAQRFNSRIKEVVQQTRFESAQHNHPGLDR